MDENFKLGVVAHTCDVNTRESERVLPCVWVHPGLCGKMMDEQMGGREEERIRKKETSSSSIKFQAW